MQNKYVKQLREKYGKKDLTDAQLVDWFYHNDYDGNFSREKLLDMAGVQAPNYVHDLKREFPATAGMSDAETLDWYYGNHYKDNFPREELFKRAGVALPEQQEAQPEPQSGFLGSLNRGADALVQNIVDTGGGFAEGALQTGQGAVNALRKLTGNEPVEMAPEGVTPGVNPESNYYKIGQFGGEMGALEVAGGPLGSLAGQAVKLAPKGFRAAAELLEPVAGEGVMSAAARGAGRGLTRGSTAGAIQGLIMGGNNQNYSSGRDAEAGAIVGGGISTLLGTISPFASRIAENPVVNSVKNKVFNDYIEPNIKRAKKGLGTLSPDQLAAREAELAGRPANFGDFISDGSGTQPEDLGRAIYDRATDVNPEGLEAEAVINRDAVNAGNELLANLRGDIGENSADDILRQSLKDKTEMFGERNNALYEKLKEDADKAGIKIDYSNYSKELDKSVERERLNPESSLESRASRAAKRAAELRGKPSAELKLSGERPEDVADYLEAVKKQKPSKKTDVRFRDALETYKQIGRSQQSARVAGDNNSAINYGNSRKAIEKDINEALQKALKENPNNAEYANLVEDWKDANAHHKEFMVPYKDKHVAGYLEGTKGSEKLASAINNDERAKIIDHMTPQEKNLLLHQYLAQGSKLAEGGGEEIALNRAIGQYDKMPDALKNKLITPQLKKEFDRLKRLQKMTAKSRLRASPPPTGAQNSGMLRGIQKNIGKGFAGGASAFGASKLSPGSIPGALAALLYGNRLRNLYRTGQSNLEYSPLLRQLYREERAPEAGELLKAINLPLNSAERVAGSGIASALDRAEALKAMGVGRAIPRGILQTLFNSDRTD